MTAPDTIVDAPGSMSAVRALRRTRQRHRLGNIEWFDAAYRAYLVGIFGGGSVLWISSSIHDSPLSSASVADFGWRAPSLLGLIVAVALLAGLRGGIQGGPVALEAADVVHVMLSPVDRRRALLRPALQRVRSAAFASAVAGAIAGEMASRRLPGSMMAWAGSGALFGASVALLWAGAALLAHTLTVGTPGTRRMPGWAATIAGIAALIWQSLAVYTRSSPALDPGSTGRVLHGPFDRFGSLALWGWRQHAVDLVAIAIAMAAVIAGLMRLRRISLDALARRSQLVAQLRFAVTMQDLRTVILLRRQLNQEHARRRPWGKRTAGAGGNRRGDQIRAARRSMVVTHAVWQRGWHGLLRFPATRIARIVALAAAFGVLQATVVRGTTPAVLLSALIAFVVGLEVMEPLSQEIDQPDRTDSFPIERGELLFRHLFASAVALVPFGVVAGAATALSLRSSIGASDAIVVGSLFAIPNLLAASTGAVVSIVRDAPDPVNADRQSLVPPEMAGLGTTLRLLLPIVVSGIGAALVFVLRVAIDNEQSIIGASARAAVGAVLLALLVGYWVRVRDRARRKIRAFMDEGRMQTGLTARSGYG